MTVATLVKRRHRRLRTREEVASLVVSPISYEAVELVRASNASVSKVGRAQPS